MSKENGGQAFPRQQWEYDGQNNVLQYQEEGMTLRDHFAGLAMNHLISEWPDGMKDEMAKQAYIIADAMIEARGK